MGYGISAWCSFSLRHKVSPDMGNEISVSGIERRDRAKGARANTTNMHKPRCDNCPREYRKRSRTHIGVVSTDNGAIKTGAVYKGTIIEIDPG